MLKKIRHFKDIMLFAGVTSEEYENIKPVIQRANQKSLVWFTLTATLAFTILFLSSFFSTFLSNKAIFYFCEMILMAGIAILNQILPKKYPKMVLPLFYAFLSTFFALGIFISITHPDYPAVSAIALLAILPNLAIDRPYRLNLFTIIASSLLVLASYNTKSWPFVVTDFFDCFLFGIMSSIVFSYLTMIKVRALVMSQKIKHISEFDALTGLQNRRASEDMLKNAEEKIKTVIVFDVNNLKWVNDTLGHNAGDELLIGTTQCLLNSFEKNTIFRIGGDEFVGLLDEDSRQVDERIKKFKAEVNRWQGKIVQELAVAVGSASRSEHPDLNIPKLTKIADEAMYQDKRAYYENNSKFDRRRR